MVNRRHFTNFFQRFFQNCFSGVKNAQVFPMSILGRKQKRIVLTLLSKTQKGLGIQKAEKLKSSTVNFQGRRR